MFKLKGCPFVKDLRDFESCPCPFQDAKPALRPRPRPEEEQLGLRLDIQALHESLVLLIIF